mmetsp:Transcript_1080/g.1975  ORF Transcript_1080/g.1975 Transcript_1080/m.1975 type:complete len:568 (+) Transcript_1080:157-1860(+)
MKALATFVLLSLPPLVALERRQAKESVEDGSVACAIAAPVAPGDGSAMLQHSKNHAAEVVMTSDSAQGSEDGPGSKTSIFKISISQLDNQAFHIIFAIMILFTICIDRLQKVVAQQAKTSVVEARLMNRVNAELMMFGIVGLSIFIVTNLYSSIPEDWTLYITFADIFASLAACSMICVTVMLYWFKNLTLPFLESFEKAIGAKREKTTKRGMSEVSELGRSHSGIFNGLGQHEYHMMMSVFSKKHTIPEDVKYVDYLSECLVHNACDIMDIHWTSWFIILIFSVFSAVNRFFRAANDMEHPFFHYVVMYSICNYVFFACSMIIFFAVNANYNKMFDYLSSIGSVDKEELEYENPMPENFGKRIKFGMQVMTLLNAFSFALYIMTWLYNLSTQRAHWSVYIVLLLPPFVSTVAILPLTIFRFTLVHSFYTPNQDALDVLFEQYDRLEDDLNYLGRLYDRKGRPELPELDKGCTEEKLAKIVRSLGLHISDTRMHRIFKALDKDKSGDIDTQEFFEIMLLAGDVAASTPRGRYTESCSLKSGRFGSATGSQSVASSAFLVSPRRLTGQ